ncbi:MAG: C4-dicarboxylate TRAP transporter large permease protein DctM [Firmicutes bacterium]|nr:C4-dicarboxylate TRAP transporter large permease protein DctM [Bacillota bacterium]MBT9157214.1 C4-dicarboxylate TRAP transporter large permease protein DctM [Bacillota bacterium]
MSPELMVAAMFILLLAGIGVGIPVASVLGGLGLSFGLAMWGNRAVHVLLSAIFGVMSSDVLIALPLFVFMGCMMEASGVADRLFTNLRILLGSMRGGLGIVAIILATVLAATTGIIGASIVMMATLALPSMLKAGYNKSLAAGIICAGGSLGILIPPSNMLILYGLAAGVPIISLFAGAVGPGLLLSALYIAYVAIRCYLRPELGPPIPLEERQAINPVTFTRDLLVSLVPPAFLIAAVLGTIFLGVAAPVEAAAAGSLGAAILALAAGRLNFRALQEAARHTLQISSTILWLVVGASMFTAVFLALGGGVVAKDAMLSLAGGSPAVVLLMMMLLLFVLGKLLCWVGILMIVIPIFTPIAAALGFDPLWFGLLVAVNLQMSLLTPPFAYSIFYLKQVAPPEVTLGDIYRGVWPFITLQALGLFIIIIFPEIVLWLPRLLGR